MKTISRPGIIQCLAIASILLVTFTACSKTGVSNNGGVYTYVSVMNLASYSPSTEIYFNGAKSTSPIPAGNYSSSYAPLKPGSYDVQFKLAGSDSVMADIPSSSYDSTGFYTLIMYNKSKSSPATAVKIQDDFSNVSVSNANFRFFNMCPDAPLVDLYLGTTLTQTRRSVADNVSDPLFNSFQSVTPGVYNLVVKVAGTDSVIASTTSYNMMAQNVYTIFLNGKAGSTSNPLTVSVLRASF